MSENVRLVLDNGVEKGLVSKAEAHLPPGSLHLAFSVFVFDDRGRTLLQRRADSKYHFAGLWSNACCSHQESARSTVAAAERRLVFETGVSAALRIVGHFVYRAKCKSSGLVEYEYDYVLVGDLRDTEFEPNPLEVGAVRWASLDQLRSEIAESPERFTPWLTGALSVVERSSERSND